VSYVPQIAKIVADRNGASAISYSTGCLWTATHIATALHAAVNVQDLYFSVVSGIYATCCLIVIGLTAIKRRAARAQREGASGGAGSPLLWPDYHSNRYCRIMRSASFGT
jgi:hypothetical protein